MLNLFDYLYLDTVKLHDYMAGLGAGEMKELRETIKLEGGDGGAEPISFDPSLQEKDAKKVSTHERTLSISEKHSFVHLRRTLEGDIKQVGENDELNPSEVRKGDIVEVSREYEPSPFRQMMDSFVELMSMMQGFGMDLDMDPDGERAMNFMALMFRGQEGEQKGLPMVSAAGSSAASVFFVARRECILCDADDFEGEATMLGKVERVIDQGASVDLLDLLKVLPRSMRRGKTAVDMKKSIIELFDKWPDELGGALPEGAFELRGPAVVVSPLAVYR